MKIYITKDALKRGILEIDGEASEYPMEATYGVNKTVIKKPFWYYTRADAIKHAEVLRVKKIKKLNEEIEKLSSIQFT